MSIHDDPAGDDPLTGPETIAARWPYDGPHSREQVTEAADALYSLIRYLNNATGPGAGRQTLGWAVTSYRVAGGVKSSAAAMDQLLRQLAGALTDQAADNPTLYDDRHDRPAGDTARQAADALTAARAALDQVVRHLEDATNAAGHLGND